MLKHRLKGHEMKIHNTLMKKPVLVVVALIIIVALGSLVSINITKNKGSNSQSQAEATRLAFNSANFVNPLEKTNKYHPLTPGMQWTRAGTTEVGSRKVPHQVITIMTDVVRIIDGVPAIAMLDQSTDSGKTSQVGFDYLAIDKDSNVWILGGYTENYEGGQYTNVESSWLGEADGGKVGILMPGNVTQNTPRWFIGGRIGEDPSVGEPVAVGQDITVKFGTFHDVLAVREGGSKAVDNEIKYYAPGVGVILNTPKSKSLHQDDFQLINLFNLSPEGLSEASKTVLDLEAHARQVSTKVYGNVDQAKRLP